MSDDPLLSDEPTTELVVRARQGDSAAMEALLARCLPALKRWASGRLPKFARSVFDTDDLVQDAVVHAVHRADAFEPRHVGAMQAYLRMSVINRIRDEVRRVQRRTITEGLQPSDRTPEPSPLEKAIANEAYERYEVALNKLSSRDRAIVVHRIELQQTYQEITSTFRMPSTDAARLAVMRALKRLAERMPPQQSDGPRHGR